MGKTYTDFSQLSKGMFKKSDPVVEIKPIPKKSAGGDDALAYFGLNAPEAPTRAPGGGADDGRIQALEANVAALRAESAALGAAKAETERKSSDLEQQLAAERQMRASAEAERDRLRGEVLRLKNELEEALTAPQAQSAAPAPAQEARIVGLLKPPATVEVFPGEVRGKCRQPVCKRIISGARSVSTARARPLRSATKSASYPARWGRHPT